MKFITDWWIRKLQPTPQPAPPTDLKGIERRKSIIRQEISELEISIQRSSNPVKIEGMQLRLRSKRRLIKALEK